MSGEWSGGSARLVQAVRAHRGEVAAVDARGGRLATAGGCGAVRAWRWEPGAGWQPAGEARTAHRYGAVAVRWAGSGALLASGGVDGAARVWSALGGSLQARRTLAAPGAAAVRALCWAGGGGTRLLAGHDDGTVCVWSAPRGQLLARVSAHEASVRALATPGRGDLLLTACTDGVLKVFDLVAVCSSGAGAAPLQWEDGAHDLGALCADTAEGGAAATGGHDARIRVWRPTGVGHAGPRLLPAGTLVGHAAAVTALCWAGELLASASLDRTARLWAPHAASCLLVVPAHPRYLTSVALAPDLRYLVTGSNDKSFRMWSLGAFSLEDSLEPPCVALAHFALGDLEGIEPLQEEDEGDVEAPVDGEEGGVTCMWRAQAHAGPINCIATWVDLLATASSDGTVKIWSWIADMAGGTGRGTLEVVHVLEGHRYPALTADFGAGGAVLLTAGLDGCAFLWDVQAGVVLRTLVVPGGAGGEAGEGGGGVRGARVSPHRHALLLLATDDGLAALWGLTDLDPHPTRVYAEGAEAALCCAWSADGRMAALGTEGGALRLLTPPAPGILHHEPNAHDLGVLSCDFALDPTTADLLEGSYLLATAGSDSLVKLWQIDLLEDGTSARVQEMAQVAAHGGAVANVRWSGARLVTAGADRWVRMWRVQGGGGLEGVGAVPVRGAGGAGAAVLAARGALLAAGDLAGELTLWRLDAALDVDDDDGAAPRFWGTAGVARWLCDYILHVPGSRMSPATAAVLQSRAHAARLTGARLLEDPVEDLLDLLGLAENRIFEEAESEEGAGSLESGGAGGDEESAERSEVRQRVCSELSWLRTEPPSFDLERVAPHGLLCPVSHRLLREPARAADGYTYERANLLEWLRASPPGGAVSPVSGRRLSSTSVAPNYKLRDTLRAFLQAATDHTDATAGADTGASMDAPDDGNG